MSQLEESLMRDLNMTANVAELESSDTPGWYVSMKFNQNNVVFLLQIANTRIVESGERRSTSLQSSVHPVHRPSKQTRCKVPWMLCQRSRFVQTSTTPILHREPDGWRSLFSPSHSADAALHPKVRESFPNSLVDSHRGGTGIPDLVVFLHPQVRQPNRQPFRV